MTAPLEEVALPSGKASGESIEERCFSAGLICLEGHYTQSPPMGPLTAAKVNGIISKTLEKTHTLRKARYAAHRPLLNLRLRVRANMPQRGALKECRHMDMVDSHICRSNPQPDHQIRRASCEPQ